VAQKLLPAIFETGRKPGDVIVDVSFMPISTDCSSARSAIDAIAAIRREWPDVHIGGGVSNVSFGLPKRRFVNLAVVSQAIYAGMDTCIIDPCGEGMLAMIHAARATSGLDEFCMSYVTAEREGKLM
jgi:5-methyltetrahydrofolate--homocysteine methyltransferase